MNKIVLTLSLFLGVLLLDAQTATVEIFRQSSDSSLQAVIRWDHFQITYQERGHHSFLTEESASDSTDLKSVARTKGRYEVALHEKFMVDISDSSGKPNSVLRVVDRAYADMTNEEALLRCMPEKTELVPDLSNGRGRHDITSFHTLWNQGRCGIEISEDGPAAQAVVEDVSYQGYPFDSIPYNIPFQKVQIPQEKIFLSLADPSYFKYAVMEQDRFETMRALAFAGMRKRSLSR